VSPAAPAAPAGRVARFDGLALRPPAAAADEAAWATRQPAAWAALQAWCRGAGQGRPAVATLAAADPARAAAFADALARDLDGGTRLDALPRLAGWAWRAAVLWRDRRGAAAADPAHPWDAGWVRSDPAALAHWAAGGFRPRRATLLLADAGAAGALRPVLDRLRRAGGAPAPALRWLWVGEAGPAADAGTRFTLL